MPHDRIVGDAAVAYGRKPNIGVPDLDAAAGSDTEKTAIATAAALRETDRPDNFAPDAADYTVNGEDRDNT